LGSPGSQRLGDNKGRRESLVELLILGAIGLLLVAAVGHIWWWPGTTRKK
jgi:Tfp pilus assembly protein PilW